MWRSLVAHLHGVQGVEGSNPFTPTRSNKKAGQHLLTGFFHGLPDALCHRQLRGLVFGRCIIVQLTAQRFKNVRNHG